MSQKLLLMLLVASRKLHHYFQGHPIKVVSAYPLERVLRSPNAVGRVAERNIELQAFQLEFCTTRVIKGVALADFVAECTDAPGPEAGEDRSLSPGGKAPDGWVMYFDGAFVSNNIAEYEGLITGLKAPAALGVNRLTIKGNSQLLINFSNKVYEPKDEHVEAYLAEVRKMEKQLLGLELQHVPRGTNKEANDIAKRASKRQPQELDIFEERLFKPSAAPPATEPTLPQEELPPPPTSGAPACGPTSGACLLLALEPQEGCWTKEFKAYLLQGTLLEKEEDAERVARQATTYCIQDGELYRKRPNDVSMRCISREQGCDLLTDIHSRDCGHHSSSRTLVGKICYASVAHPRSNGQAERANTDVLRGLKARTFKKKLEACSRSWLDELQSVLWSIRTTATKPTGETPFFLVYGAEVVLPHEVMHRFVWVLAFDEPHQDATQGMDLVLGEEHRRQASLRVARNQQALRRKKGKVKQKRHAQPQQITRLGSKGLSDSA
ncbi:uncharacterized protein [Aegilops tauschii subsp. strangulata]|uniref:uncharacterized protein n=1 Tax=Aegilops tauschii subsp. strangulata TaxID=200361 RepID=UPI003CC8B632